MAEEIWKDIPSLVNYEASSEGRIRCVERYHEEIVEDNTPGEVLVGFGTMGKISRKRDWLVANAFMTRPTGKVTLHHIDGDESNCRADNLEWVCTAKGSRMVMQCDPEDRVVREYTSITYASRITGISYQGILRCCTGTQTLAGGYKWWYKDEYKKPKLYEVEHLVECPFCGGTAKFVFRGRAHRVCHVECTECGMRTPDKETSHEAAEVWNHRGNPNDPESGASPSLNLAQLLK